MTFEQHEREQIQLAAQAALARTEYLPYTKLIDPGYTHPHHVRVLGSYLQAVEVGDILKLLIIMPPQNGKSECSSGKFPAWCIGKDPKRKVIVTSYGSDLAETFSVQNRDTIMYNPMWPLVFPDVTINPALKGRTKWGVAGARESCIAAGAGGPITGYGSWLLLMDDLTKNYEEGISSTIQDATWNWYLTTALTRVGPEGRQIAIGTNWTEIDFISRLKKEEGWTILHLPALSYGLEEDYITLYPRPEQRAKVVAALPKTAFPDRLGRHKDEPLWPERYDKEFLLIRKMTMQEAFESLYQGNPGKPEGAKFKRSWFRPMLPTILDQLNPEVVSRFRSWDLAWTKSDRANHTVGLRATLYKLRKDADLHQDITNLIAELNIPPVFLVLEDLQRFKQEWDEVVETVVGTTINDTDRYDVLVEAVAAQSIPFKAIRTDKRAEGYKFTGVQPSSDKIIRSNAAMNLGRLGMYFILYPNATSPPHWEEEFLVELAKFPNATDDDQVDAFTQLVNHNHSKIMGLINTTTRLGQWVTPFMRPQPQWGQERVAKIPPELRSNTPRRWQRDRLGWL